MDPRRLSVLVCSFIAIISLSCNSTELNRSKAERLISESKQLAPAIPRLTLKHEEFLEKGGREGYWKPKRVWGIFQTADLTPKGKQVFSEVTTFYVVLAQTFSRRVIEVTGITEIPSALGIKEAHFTWAWADLPKVVTEYCNTGPRKGEAILRLYDDGWRVEALDLYLEL